MSNQKILKISTNLFPIKDAILVWFTTAIKRLFTCIMEDDFVEHRTLETSFAAQRTNHSANSMCKTDETLSEEDKMLKIFAAWRAM